MGLFRGYAGSLGARSRAYFQRGLAGHGSGSKLDPSHGRGPVGGARLPHLPCVQSARRRDRQPAGNVGDGGMDNSPHQRRLVFRQRNHLDPSHNQRPVGGARRPHLPCFQQPDVGAGGMDNSQNKRRLVFRQRNHLDPSHNQRPVGGPLPTHLPCFQQPDVGDRGNRSGYLQRRLVFNQRRHLDPSHSRSPVAGALHPHLPCL